MKIRLAYVAFAILSTMQFAVAQQGASSVPDTAVTGSSVPRVIRFSGVAKDTNGKPLIGTIGITFLLYKDEQDTAPLWMETQNVQPDVNGHYSVQLGSTQPGGLPVDLFTSGEARWLSVSVPGSEDLPRILLVSVPYAIKAHEAETLAGKLPSEFVLASDLLVRVKEAEGVFGYCTSRNGYGVDDSTASPAGIGRVGANRAGGAAVLLAPSADQTIKGTHKLIVGTSGGVQLLYTGLPQSLVTPDNRLPGTFTAANINGAGGFGTQTPAISGSSQSDGTIDTTAIVGLSKIDTKVSSTHFHSGVVGYVSGKTTAGTIERLNGVLGVPHAESTGSGSIVGLSAFNAFGPTVDRGSHVQAAVGFNSEANFGTFAGQIDSMYGFLANSPGGLYTSGTYYGMYIGGGVTAGTSNYGMYIDNTGFNGPKDYGIYVQQAKNNLGTGTTTLGKVAILTTAFGSIGACNAGAEGTLKPVTDSNTNTWGATVGGGGANHVLAYCDGTNWTVAAK